MAIIPPGNDRKFPMAAHPLRAPTLQLSTLRVLARAAMRRRTPTAEGQHESGLERIEGSATALLLVLLLRWQSASRWGLYPVRVLRLPLTELHLCRCTSGLHVYSLRVEYRRNVLPYSKAKP